MCVRYNLAVDDYYTLKNKIAVNDITNEVMSYSSDNKCSLQEAIDYHYKYILDLDTKCKQLSEELLSNKEFQSKEFQFYIEGLENQRQGLISVLIRFLKFQISDDLSIHSPKWDQLYDSIVKYDYSLVNPWTA